MHPTLQSMWASWWMLFPTRANVFYQKMAGAVLLVICLLVSLSPSRADHLPKAKAGTMVCPEIHFADDFSIPLTPVGQPMSVVFKAFPEGNYQYTLIETYGNSFVEGNYSLNASTGEFHVSEAKADPEGYEGVFIVRATDSNGCYYEYVAGFTGQVQCPSITFPATLPKFVSGLPYSASLAVVPAGNYTYSIVDGYLPMGITLDSLTGMLSGRPTYTFQIGDFTISANNINYCTTQKRYNFEVFSNPTRVPFPASLPKGKVGQAYFATINPGIGYGYLFLQGNAGTPPGVEFDYLSGEISGIPSQAGTYHFNTYGESYSGYPDVSLSYDIVIEAACFSLPDSVPAMITGKPYFASFAASPAGAYTYTYQLDEGNYNYLPQGLSLDSTTGVLSGTPATGSPGFEITITATSASGCSYAKLYKIPSICPLTLPATIPNGQVGVAYAANIQVTNETGAYTYRAFSLLPDGLFVESASGQLKGSPTTAGTYAFTIEARGYCYTYKNYTMTVAPAPAPTGTSKVRINCGGSDFKVANGLTFKADAYFSGLTKTSSTGGAIAGTVNDPIYYTDRVADVDKGTFRYQVPVANGKYQVNLFLAETYFTAAGKRLMSVKAEADTVLRNYDIFAAQGKRTAKMLSYIVTVADGNMTLDFWASVNRPKINAIEIVPAPANAARQEEESELETELTTSAAFVAYPNPFADQTSIRFMAEVSGKASIAVYDLSGSLVKGLFEGELEAGVSQELTLEGSSLPSGIYLVKATFPAGVSHLKLVLTK